MSYNRRASRFGFYVIILAMLFLSVSLFIYAESGVRFIPSDKTEETSVSGFRAIEISHIPPGAQALMKAFLPSTGRAYAGQRDDGDPYALDKVILSTTEDGVNLRSSGSDDDELDDDLLLAERAVAWQEYIVKQGETLSEIVAKFSGISMNDIVRANELLSASRLVGKQILLIPLGEEFVEDTLEEVRIRKARVVASREGDVPVEVKSYEVKDGETLWSIADAMDVEIDTLIGCNNIGAVLRAGATLRVPNQDGIFYTVKLGDHIRALSSRFKIALNVLQQVNKGLDLEKLSVGEEVFLPGARPEVVQEPKQRVANKPDAPRNTKIPPAEQVKTPSGGPFRWPVAGTISSPFGWRRHPIFRRADFHSALDIKAARGTTIRASRGGTVVYAGWQGGYGNTVVIDHGGGYSSLYAHCNSISVQKGQAVSANSVIASVGSTGRATGPHVHFEIRVNNRAVNPISHLK